MPKKPRILTSDTLNEIETRAKAATLSEWVTYYDVHHEGWWVDTNSNEYEQSPLSLLIEDSYVDAQAELDAKFVAHARQDVPDLVAALRQAWLERASLRDHIKEANEYAPFALTDALASLTNKSVQLGIAKQDATRLRSVLKEAAERSDLDYHYTDCVLTTWALRWSGRFRNEAADPSPDCSCGLDTLCDRINQAIMAEPNYVDIEDHQIEFDKLNFKNTAFATDLREEHAKLLDDLAKANKTLDFIRAYANEGGDARWQIIRDALLTILGDK